MLKRLLTLDFLKGTPISLFAFSLPVFPTEEIRKIFLALMAVYPLEAVFDYDTVLQEMERPILKLIVDSMANEQLKAVFELFR